jgi:hypothetical protein
MNRGRCRPIKPGFSAWYPRSCPRQADRFRYVAGSADPVRKTRGLFDNKALQGGLIGVDTSAEGAPALSRPDHHVAWCGDYASVDPLSPIDHVSGVSKRTTD